MMNGDFSLLSPEAYFIPKNLIPKPTQSNSDFSWVSVGMKTPLKFIDAGVFNPSGPTMGRNNPLMYSLSDKGFVLPSILWKIDEFVDVTPIMEAYSESWYKLRTSYRRQNRKISKAAKKEQYATDRDNIEINKAHWLATTHLLFEIIVFLRDCNKVAVADSIWQSVMNAHWQRGRVVESTLHFDPHLKLENRQKMFHLEKGSDGGFHPWWLIDRIMYKGGFWVGRMENAERLYAGFEPPLENMVEEHPTIEQIKNEEHDQQDHGNFPEIVDLRLSGDAETDIISIPSSDEGARKKAAGLSVKGNQSVERQKHLSNPSSAQRKKKDHIYFSKKTHAEKQFTGSMFWKIAEAMVEMMDENEGDEKENPLGSFYTTPEALSSFARAVVSSDIMSKHPLNEQRAVFDIDGNEDGSVLVLTPFNEHLETIPRPEIRSMSVSWVIDRVDNLSFEQRDGNKTMNIEETLRAKGMVRGMWTFMMNPVIKYNLV